MEVRVEQMLLRALDALKREGKVPADFEGGVAVERPRREEYGDFGSALPLLLAKVAKQPPAVLAKALIEKLEAPDDFVAEVSFAPPGYVNFRIRPEAWFGGLQAISSNPGGFGDSDSGQGERILLEFVSANPTGPLHVGHGRGAVLGDALARVMRAAGYAVDTEYYLNDVGNQMAMLGRSLHARGREILGLDGEFPENGYHGQYIRDLAAEFVSGPGRAACEREYEELGAPDDTEATRFASSRLLGQIRDTLDRLDVRFGRWTSERSLHEAGRLRATVDALLASGAAYRADDGSIRFRMDGTEDEEDRVVVRANGIPTYFASDIAYHLEKAERGYQRLINIWGADHHGYIPRMKASLAAFGRNPDMLEVLLVQMVTLTRGGVPIPMGKRSGKFVTLDEVIAEVGRDAVRFLFLLRRSDAQMEFDLDLARSQSMENPVYYVQYGHARVAAILRRAAAAGHEPPPWSFGLREGLTLPEEAALVRELCRLPGVIAGSARRREPHHIAFYLVELVKSFHSYYTRYKHTEKVISPDSRKTEARLFLVSCLKTVLCRGLTLLGVSAPEEMHYEVEDEPA